jgi:hypothetical protein
MTKAHVEAAVSAIADYFRHRQTAATSTAVPSARAESTASSTRTASRPTSAEETGGSPALIARGRGDSRVSPPNAAQPLGVVVTDESELCFGQVVEVANEIRAPVPDADHGDPDRPPRLTHACAAIGGPTGESRWTA